MNKNSYEQDPQSMQEHVTENNQNKSTLRQLSYSWNYWVFLIMTLSGIFLYIINDNIKNKPQNQSILQTEKANNSKAKI